MSQHFLLSSKARTISLPTVLAMTDQQVEETFANIRWSSTNGEPVCPHCGSLTCYEARRPKGSLRYRCKDCRKDFTLTSGTLFAFHKLPLKTYLAITVSFCCEVKGKSALALTREFSIQYKTAFVLAHKLREAMITDAPDDGLGGEGKVVENDGAYFGGKIRQENLKSDRIDRRLTENKNGKQQCVVVVRERSGRTVPKVLQNERAGADFIASIVKPGSTLMTDGAKAWEMLKRHFPVRQISHKSAFSLNGASTNLAESFFSRMRRAEWGHHHRLSGTYLERYAIESAWREDNRRLDNGAQVRAVIGLALAAKPSGVFNGYWQGGKRATTRTL